MPSSGRTSENRRMNKPIMEKRRRARINDCLNELKSLVLEGLKKDPARHSKLEKADILEMAVNHLRSLQTRPAAPAARFQEGYADCAKEVASYLNGRQELDLEIKQRLMVHLASAYRPQATPATPVPVAPATAGSPPTAAVLGSLQLVPTVLASGEVGYILQRAPAGLLLTQQRDPATAPLSVCTEPAAASVGSVDSSSVGSVGSSSVGSISPAPSWDPAEPRSPSSPSLSEGSFGSCEGGRGTDSPQPLDLVAHSPRPLDLVAHSRAADDETHWRPW